MSLRVLFSFSCCRLCPITVTLFLSSCQWAVLFWRLHSWSVQQVPNTSRESFSSLGVAHMASGTLSMSAVLTMTSLPLGPRAGVYNMSHFLKHHSHGLQQMNLQRYRMVHWHQVGLSTGLEVRTHVLIYIMSYLSRQIMKLLNFSSSPLRSMWRYVGLTILCSANAGCPQQILYCFIKVRPREWLAFNAFRVDGVYADKGYMKIEVIVQHRDTWYV